MAEPDSAECVYKGRVLGVTVEQWPAGEREIVERADAVAIGRPAVWGLAAAGEEGVTAVLRMLRRELENALTLCGFDSPRAVGRDTVSAGPC